MTMAIFDTLNQDDHVDDALFAVLYWPSLGAGEDTWAGMDEDDGDDGCGKGAVTSLDALLLLLLFLAITCRHRHSSNCEVNNTLPTAST